MVDKYPFIDGPVLENSVDEGGSAKQSIIDMTATQVGTDVTRWPSESPRPGTQVIVTSEAGRIVVHYWGQPPEGGDGTGDERWQQHVRLHEEVARFSRDMRRFPTEEWCQRLGVTVTETHVLVFFKRKLPTESTGEEVASDLLYCDVYEWVEEDRRLVKRTEDPAVVPLGDEIGAGFYVWAGYWAGLKTIVLLVQVCNRIESGGLNLGSCQLRLYSQSVYSELPAPGDPARWKFYELEAGGFDIEARIKGDQISILHRRPAWPIEVSIGNEAFGSAGHDMRYQPLRLIRFDLGSIPLIDLGTELVPGGEHPRIHHVDPFFYTVERPCDGWLRSFEFPHYGNDEPGPLVLVTDDIRAWTRFAVVVQEQHWSVGPIDILKIRRSEIPRDLSVFGERQFPLWLKRGDQNVVRSGTVIPMVPVVLASLEELPEEGLSVVFLCHEPRLESLMATAIRLDPLQPELRAFTGGQKIIDINRQNLSQPNFVPSAWGENRQFGTFETALAPQILTDDALGLAREPWRYDNTIGGRVCVSGEGGILVYSDLGDGAARVRSSIPDDLPVLNESPIGRGISLDDITAPADASDAWINLSPPSGETWLELPWPNYAAPYQGPTRAARTILMGAVTDPNVLAMLQERRSFPTALQSRIGFMNLVLPELAAGGSIANVDTTTYNITDGLYVEDAQTIDRISLLAPESDQFATPETALPLAGLEITVTVTPSEAVRGQQVEFEGVVSRPPFGPIGETTMPEWTIRRADAASDLSNPSSWPVILIDAGPVISVDTEISDQALYVMASASFLMESTTLEFQVDLNPSVWTDVWSLHDDINADDEWFQLRNARLTARRYQLDFLHDENGDRDRIEIVDLLGDGSGRTVSSWCRFVGAMAQGSVEHRTDDRVGSWPCKNVLAGLV